MNSERRNPMSSIECLDTNQLIPDDRLSFYGLLERVSEYSQDDPVHNNVDLFSGIDTAYNVFRFSVEALALLHRHARPAFMMVLCRLGAATPNLGRRGPPIKLPYLLCWHTIRVLRRLLCEVEGGKRHAEAQKDEVLRPRQSRRPRCANCWGITAATLRKIT